MCSCTTCQTLLEARYELDCFFTPDEVAEHLIRISRSPRSMNTIADFAVGTGQLLRYASNRWPEARLIATDVQIHRLRRLRRQYPNWEVAKLDFLNDKARKRSSLLTKLSGRIDLVLLNPPFSCRGGTRYWGDLFGNRVSCSLAMAFVLISVNYLRAGGELRAVLPTSVLSSQKDSEARDILKQYASFETIADYGKYTFEGCFPRTNIVRIRRSRNCLSSGSATNKRSGRSRRTRIGPIEILRGSIQMHTFEEAHGRGSIPLIHTTELRSEEQLDPSHRVKRGGKIVAGPAVLLPRVGRPNVEKVVLLLGNRKVALSDCVFALRCPNHSQAKRLYSQICKRWRVFKAAYTGTCAPYTTIGGIAKRFEVDWRFRWSRENGKPTVSRKPRPSPANLLEQKACESYRAAFMP